MAATTIYLHRETNAPSVPLVFTGAAMTGSDVEIVLAPKFAGPEVRLTTGAGDIVIVDDERLILSYDDALVAALPLGLVTTWDAYQIDGEERRHLGGGMVRVLGAGESAPGGDVTVQVPGLPGARGWTAIEAAIADGARRVRQIVDWFGGGGDKPVAGQFVGAAGLVDDLASAVDFRGDVGQTPNITIGTVTTLAAGAPATFVRRPESADEAPVIDVGLPQGAGIEVIIVQNADWPPPVDPNPSHWYVRAMP